MQADSSQSHLFKSTWNDSQTKVIRVPTALADVLLEIAHKIDDGEPPEDIYQLVMQSTVSLNWDRCAALIESAIQDVPLLKRQKLREALLLLFSSSYFYSQHETMLRPSAGAIGSELITVNDLQ